MPPSEAAIAADGLYDAIDIHVDGELLSVVASCSVPLELTANMACVVP
jgi:hypothetical protein